MKETDGSRSFKSIYKCAVQSGGMSSLWLCFALSSQMLQILVILNLEIVW